MLLIGLTGSIATGKSTVSALLSAPPYNLPIIDADLLARQVVSPGTSGYKQIVAHFGPTTPDLLYPPSELHPGKDGPNGKGRELNRPALGRRVFGDSEERRRDRGVLNGITHPAVRWEMYKAVIKCYIKGHWGVVLDVPLLFESGLDALCGSVIVVAVSDMKVQMARLMARDAHLSEEEARDRVGSQGGVMEKVDRVKLRGVGRGEVVWNDAGKDALVAELDRVVGSLKAHSPVWWGWLLWVLPPFAGVAGLVEYVNGLRSKREWDRMKLEEKAKL
jgi:dephospho-CoA kinase